MKTFITFSTSLMIIVHVLTMDMVLFGQELLYLDPKQPIEKRAEDLLSRMTLEEKIGQLNVPCVYAMPFKGLDNIKEGCRKFIEGTLEPNIGPGGGLMQMRDISPDGPRRQAEFHNELQKIAVEKTRLKIPLMMIDEATHGVLAPGATIFPEGLAIGSTWNMELVKDVYAIVAKEARATGSDHLCTLVIEPNRDPRLGRNCQTYSEDPYLCSRLAESIVEGAQGDDISAPDKAVAVLCHFPGQSQPVSGLNGGDVEMSERSLREVFLPPWEAGIKKAGALGVMSMFPAYDGITAHSSKFLLTKVLREELGFKGLVLSEGGSFLGFAGYYSVLKAESDSLRKVAGARILNAGVDVDIYFQKAYMSPMIENVHEGQVSMSMIDRAVNRILLQKFRLGLFERPFVDPEYTDKAVHNEEHQKLALQTAREGIVLLKNENNLLPLKKDIGSIAVIGPNADDALNLLGGDYHTHKIPSYHDIVTVLEGIRKKVSAKTKVTYIKGCNVFGTELNEIARAKKAAKNADIAIVVVGENERYSPNGGSNGEFRDIATLDLTGMQEDLVKAVYESGTPTIVVLTTGRPLSTRWIAEKIPAVALPWFSGEKGGDAIADVIFGDYNPSGRLPITVPRSVGHLPAYYNYKYTKAGKPYVDSKSSPLYEFGYGLSYTTFNYANLDITPQQTGRAGEINISLDVTNTGDRSGSEVVQLYVSDITSSVNRPVIELKGFEKVPLQPGEKRRVEFTLGPEHLSFFDENMERIVEPGKFEIRIGSSSKDIRLKGIIEITK